MLVFLKILCAKKLLYNRMLFKYEILLIANCKFFTTQLLESQLKSDVIRMLYISTQSQLLESHITSDIAIRNYFATHSKCSTVLASQSRMVQNGVVEYRTRNFANLVTHKHFLIHGN